MKKVGGNNKLYDYPIDLVEEDNMMVVKANGGFYQGFFQLEGYDYKVLPSDIRHGLDFEITLKKSEFEHPDTDYSILNDVYPENKGIFFYMGTRAENKWFKYYDTQEFPKKDIWYFDSEYIKDEFYNNIDYSVTTYVDNTPININNVTEILNSERDADGP